MEIKKLFAIWKAAFTNEENNNIQLCFNKIIEAYQGKDRHYHTLDHVSKLLQLIDREDLNPRNRQILTLVAFFHDVIYKAGSKTNELESSVFANIWLNRLPVDYDIIHPICSIIEATTNHKSEDELCQLFLDMDLSILASNDDEYAIYVENIRKENNYIPNFFFKKARKKFVTQMLLKPRIFNLSSFQQEYEIKARENLYRELQKLEV